MASPYVPANTLSRIFSTGMPNILDRFAPRSTKLSATRSNCAPGLFADLRHLHRSMVGPTAAATNRPARSRPTAFRDHRRTLWLRQADRCFQEMRKDDAPDPGRRRRGGRVAGARGAGAASARPRAVRGRPPVRLPRVPGDGAERAAALRPGEPRPQPPGATRRAGLAA